MRKFDEYMMKAKEGDSTAQYRLGKCYLGGIGVEQDSKEAFKWFQKSADQGDAEGQCGVGACYCNGEGVEQDFKTGLKWMYLSAEQKLPKAWYNIASLYLSGKYHKKNIKEAEKLLIMAARAGDEDSMYKIGKIYENEPSLRNLGKAFNWYYSGAVNGSRHSQLWLYNYFYAPNLGNNPEEGIKWLRKAAINGHTIAQCTLASYYENGGFGVPQDYNRAFRWFFIAGSRGLPYAVDKLIDFYYNGKGVERDPEKALGMCLKMLEFQPDDPNVLNEIAYILWESGVNLELAKDCSAKAVEGAPLDPDTRDTHGCILLEDGKVDAAIAEFEYCLVLDSRRSIFHEHLGDAYMTKNDNEKAFSCYHEALHCAKYDFERERIKAKMENCKEEKNVRIIK